MLLDLEQLVADQAVDARLVPEDRPELDDPLLQVGELALDLLPREPGEPAETEVENRLRLDLRQPELLLELLALGSVVRLADDADHRVEIVERDQIALEHVCA